MKLLVKMILILLMPATAIPAQDFDFKTKPVVKASVSNGSMTINFRFVGKLRLKRGSRRWTGKEIKVYKKAARRWLRVIRKPKGTKRFSITIWVQVKTLKGGLGAAQPHWVGMRKIRGNYFPTRGEMFISAYSYSREFRREYKSRRAAQAEFYANILHEMGHIFGLGSMWNLESGDGEIEHNNERPNLRHWVKNSDAYEGPIYTRKYGLAQFQRIYGKRWKFIPIMNAMSHLFSLEDGNKCRFTRDGRRIPILTNELMANGRSLSRITAGMLEDLGYAVNYNATDRFKRDSGERCKEEDDDDDED